MSPAVALSPGLRLDMPLSSLHEAPDNPRSIEPEALDQLKVNLVASPKMLEARPVICTPEGEIVAGNMRHRAAVELGWETVPTFVHPFENDGEKREWMLRDNNEFGDWVPDKLASMIYAHQQEGFDTRLLGFRDEEIEKAIRRATGEALVPEPSESPNPTLAAECMVEIRCDRDALDLISSTLESWQESIDNISIAVTQ